MDPIQAIEQGVQAILTQQYGALLAILVGVIVWVIRTWGGKISPKIAEFFKSDPGGTVLAFLTAFGVALGAVKQVSLEGIGLAGKTAFLAIGGYSVIKKFILPIIKWLLQKYFPSSIPIIEAKAEVKAKEIAKDLSAKDSLDGI